MLKIPAFAKRQHVSGKHKLTQLKRIMKKIVVGLLMTTTFVSCDYFNDTRICNQTKKEIILKITFDPKVIKTWSSGMLVENLTKTFRNWGDNLIPVNIDTINYISTYLIKPDSCGQIDGGNNRRPNFNFFKKIEIISGSNTLKLQTKEEMVKAFDADRKNSNYYFDLLIQENGKNASR